MRTNQNKKNQRVDYGQDMPGLIIIVSGLSIILLGLSIWQYLQFSSKHLPQQLTISIVLSLIGVLLATVAVVGIWSSRFGKLKLRDKTLSSLNFKGDETILDLGCGNGLLLLSAAKKLPTGKAVGADLWIPTLEFKYTSQMTVNNAMLEGVSERVEVTTADAQSLYFADCTFDVVMTSLMMHHIPKQMEALKEMVRVLKPNGTLIIADVMSKKYVPIIKSLGLNQVEVSYATRLFFTPAFIIKGVKS